jgi:uroporphyrinogen decarboxylase
VLHVCGEEVLFDEFLDYPVAAMSWATGPGNPSLSGGQRRTGRAVMGGLPAKPVIGILPPEDVTARGRRAVAEMGGRWLLLAPDCSINPDTPEAVMDAARTAVL